MTESPILLEYGDDCWARIIAVNVKGGSIPSDAGNGAKVLTRPDAPINVRDVPGVTNYETCGLEWDDGPDNGGAPVIDYRVSYN